MPPIRAINMSNFRSESEMIQFAIQESLKKPKPKPKRIHRKYKCGIKIETKRITIANARQTKECPICFDAPVIEHLVQLSCNHTYCSACITQYIIQQSLSKCNCPMCRSPIDALFVPYTSSMGTKKESKESENYKFVLDKMMITS